MGQAYRDENRVTTLLAVSSSDGTTPVTLYADPTTHRLLTTPASGSGDVVGPASSTDNAVVRFSGTTGKLVQDSSVIIDDTDNITGVATLNKITITQPATGATLTLVEGSSLVTSGANSITLTSTGATTVTLPTTGTLVTLAGSEVLTNKTLTSPVINTSVSGTAILDEDDMASDSATQLATQQSIRAYVDSASTALDIAFFFNDTASDIGGIYTDMTTNALGGGESTISTAGLSASTADQALNNYASDVTGGLGILDVPAGTFEVHFTAERTAGNSDSNIYAEIYHRASGGAETLITTTQTSGLVTSKAVFSLFAHTTADTPILATDRIVVKLLVNTGSGSGATIAIYQEGTTVSRLELPTTSEILNQIFVRQDSLGANVETALAVDVGSAGAVITFNGDAGTPSALVGTNISGTASGLTAGAVTGFTAGAGTLTGPASSGVAMTLGNTETVTGVKTFGSAGAVGRLVVAGTTSGTTVLDATAVAGTTTLTLPAATDTLVGKATTDTLTNKTFDANGTGNSLSNVDVADLANGTDGELITWSATGVAATVAVGTATHVLTSNGVGVAPTFQAAGGGGVDTSVTTQTCFENVGGGRYNDTTGSSGTVTQDTGGVLLTTSATTNGRAATQMKLVFSGSGLIFKGNPTFTARVGLDVLGTTDDPQIYFGCGELAVDTASLNFTRTHFGFVIVRESGAWNLYGTQADGTTESRTSILTAVTDNDSLDLTAILTDDTSVDYYWSLEGSTMSSATNLATNEPASSDVDRNSFQAAAHNYTTAANTVVSVKSMSYTRG